LYINNIKKLVFANDAVVLRSAATLDKITHADYLVVLDGSPFVNGEWSFASAMTFDGEIKNYENLSQTDKIFSDIVWIYATSEKRALSTGVAESAEYRKGIDCFCKLTKCDKEALNIRYTEIYHSYTYDKAVSETVTYSDMNKKHSLGISYTSEVFSECGEFSFGSGVRQLGKDGVARLIRCYRNYIENGKKVIIFTVLDNERHIRRFVGMLAFDTGVDKKATQKILTLSKYGLNTLIFSGRFEADLPKFPDELSSLPSVSCDELRAKEMPVTHNFGKYYHYRDADENDIIKIIDFLKAKKKKVAILGFSDRFSNAIQKADVFISCAPVKPRVSGYLYEEINSLTTDGGAKDASCMQTVKSEAEILVPRPKNGHGGFSSIILARKAGIISLGNLKQFVRYLMCAQIIRLCAVAIPMLLGNIALDARHVMFCSFILDFMAFALFLTNTEVYPDQKNKRNWWDNSVVQQIRDEKVLLIPAMVSVAVLIFLPRIFGFFDIGGQYWYEEGCTFSALIYLHLTVFLVLRYGISCKWKKLFHDMPLIHYVAGVFAFMITVFAFEPLRPLFGLEMGNPFPYFLLSFVPSVIFVILYYLLSNKANKYN
jgi:hypothetical protein